MPTSLAQIGDNITRHYMEARQAMTQLADALIAPVADVLGSLDIQCNPAVFPAPLGFISYPPSFYPHGGASDSSQEEAFGLLKERIQQLQNVRPVLNAARSSMISDAAQRLQLARQTEARAQQQLRLVNAEKTRLDELGGQLAERQNQLREYEKQIILQQQKVQGEIQAAGFRFKQKLKTEIDEIRREKADYEQEFAMQKARREQELLDLQAQLNSTKREICDLSLRKGEVQVKCDLEQQNSQQYMQIQQIAGQAAAEEQERLEFLQEHEVNEQFAQDCSTETLTGQCIQLFKNKECLEGQFVSRTSGGSDNSRGSIQAQRNSVERPAVQKITAQQLVKLAPQAPVDPGYTIPAQQKATPDAVPVAEWAQGEMLERCVLATYGVNPGQFFKNKGKTSVQELFGIGNHPFDMRSRQTQAWGKDKLGPKDQEFYTKGVGWLAE